MENKVLVYDLQTIEIIKRQPVDAVCIDIGVNEGQMLSYLNKHCKKGQVFGFEPIPDLNRYLTRKFKNKRIQIQELALSDVNGELEFFYFPDRKAVSGLRSREMSESYNLIKVQTRKLDDIFQSDRLDFIKIDVEGAEYNVLKGAHNTLYKHHPVLVFESGLGGLEHFGNTPEELFDFLNALNYNISTLKYYLRGCESMSKEEFLSNFLKGYDYQYIAY
ncbi:MAG TPA: FkbM family methyltransferase [Flavisolibacter sp.]|nr:FkbM family methyltransferase [Flavisolibacter sp.]